MHPRVHTGRESDIEESGGRVLRRGGPGAPLSVAQTGPEFDARTYRGWTLSTPCRRALEDRPSLATRSAPSRAYPRAAPMQAAHGARRLPVHRLPQAQALRIRCRAGPIRSGARVPSWQLPTQSGHPWNGPLLQSAAARGRLSIRRVRRDCRFHRCWQHAQRRCLPTLQPEMPRRHRHTGGPERGATISSRPDVEVSLRVPSTTTSLATSRLRSRNSRAARVQGSAARSAAKS
jgi:hypothetical protein